LLVWTRRHAEAGSSREAETRNLISPRSCCRRSVRRSTQPVVEVEEHRRALRRGLQKILELAEEGRSDRVTLIRGKKPSVCTLIGEDIEMVHPEVCHAFLELPFAVHGAKQSRLLKL